MSIPRLGQPLLLTPLFAELPTAGPVAESLVKPCARIRFKPFFAAGTLLKTMLVLHPAISIARKLNGNNERVADFQRCRQDQASFGLAAGNFL
jgi:hypothetical protein